MTIAALPLAVAGSLLVASCAGSSPTTPSAANAFHIDVTDATGDAVATPGFTTTPDLVHGTADVAAGDVTFTIQFAADTLDGKTTRLGIALDTDQTKLTGIDAWGIGVDYLLDLWVSNTQTTVWRANPGGTGSQSSPYYVNVGTASLAVGSSTLSVNVPLTVIGSTNGRMNFRCFVYSDTGLSTSAVADVMPDLQLPAAHIP
jgi:hypothetical protein